MSTRGQMIDLSMSAFTGWDQPQDVNVAPFGSSSSERTDVSGPFGGGSGQVTYSHPGKHFSSTAPDRHLPGTSVGTSSIRVYDSYAAYGKPWLELRSLATLTLVRFSEHLSYSTDYNSRAQTMNTPNASARRLQRF
jgi:hypothetical protein